MKRFRVLTVVLVICAICSQSQSQDEPAKHVSICQGSTMKLDCPNRSLAITVEAAVYGRELPGAIICPAPVPTGDQLPMTDEVLCHQDVFEEVKEKCDGKVNCSVVLNGKTFPDPCPRVYKYLDVSYKCEDVITRGIRHLAILKDKNKTEASTTHSARVSSQSSTLSTTSAVAPGTLTTEERLVTQKPATAAVTTAPSSVGGATKYQSVSVSQGFSTDKPTTVSAGTNHTEQPSSSPSPPPPTQHQLPSSSTPTPGTTIVPKTKQDHPRPKKELRIIRLFHFLLSFQIVRQEYLHKHPASSFVWFLCGVLSGLHIVVAVLYVLQRRAKPQRRQPDGTSDRLSSFKQELLPRQHSACDEKAELRSKDAEAMEMDRRFGSIA